MFFDVMNGHGMTFLEMPSLVFSITGLGFSITGLGFDYQLIFGQRSALALNESILYHLHRPLTVEPL